MAIERTEVDDLEREEKENEKARLEADKAEREALRKEAEEAKLKAAKAEGEAEALRRGISQPTSAPQWTDEQWEMEAQKHGMTGSQLKASVLVSKTVSDANLKPMQDELALARKEAKEAREEARRAKELKNSEKVKQEFYDKNAALRLHSKEVEEFLSTYPDSEEVSGDALKKRLDLASKYIKGTVKENMRTNKPSESGSSRFEGADERTDPTDIGEFDPKGTGNQGAAYLMENVHRNFGSGIRHADSIEVWKKSLDDEGRGVSISMDEDIQRYRSNKDRDFIGGKRG